MGKVKKDLQVKENDLSYRDTYLSEISGIRSIAPNTPYLRINV